MRGGGFLCCCFCIFLLSRAIKHVEEKVMDKGGEKGEAWRWFKKGCVVTVGEPSGDSAGYVGG